ncbi:hypothetical protein BDZ91DRAFT_459115 [Kalaharituber pfeilii]|nr:hypothetical protein BDZ91DRAFT_459115 [Kalaharituber pfeilii]
MLIQSCLCPYVSCSHTLSFRIHICVHPSPSPLMQLNSLNFINHMLTIPSITNTPYFLLVTFSDTPFVSFLPRFSLPSVPPSSIFFNCIYLT